MIKVDQLIYKSRQRLNKLATNEHQDIPEEDLLLIINEAQIKLVKSKANPLDGSSKRYQDIEFLIVPAEKQKLVPEIKNKHLNRWTADLSKLDPAYMLYVDSYLLCDKEDCKGRVIWVNHDLQSHGSIPSLLNNSNYKPSFEYQETFNDEQDGEMGFYTDGTFQIKEAYISYIHYPQMVDKAGYEDFEGKQSKDQDSEFPLSLENELLDIIAQDIAQYTENPSAYQAAAQSRAYNDKP